MDSNELQALLRLRHELAATKFEIALELYSRKYNESQPRVPPGQPGGGQWAGGDGGGVGAEVLLAGGFSKQDETLTVDDFIASNCLGKIHRELPGQFYGMTITDVMRLKGDGDQAASKCIKLLREDRFRK